MILDNISVLHLTFIKNTQDIYTSSVLDKLVNFQKEMSKKQITDLLTLHLIFYIKCWLDYAGSSSHFEPIYI